MRAELGLAATAPRTRVRDAVAVAALGGPMLALTIAPLVAVIAALHALL